MTSSAVLGLVDAASRWSDYCAARGYEDTRMDFFRHYASLRINGEIVEAIRRGNPMTRNQVKDLKAIKGAGINLPKSELSKVLDIPERRVSAVMAALITSASVSIEDESIVVDKGDVESSVVDGDVLNDLVDFIEGMDDTSKLILSMKYYLGMNFNQICSKLNMKKPKAVRIHVNAVLKIRKVLMRLMGYDNG